MKKLLVDKKEKIILRYVDQRVMEVIFYDSLLHNIYRAKVVAKLDGLSVYFVDIGDENLFLKSTLNYQIGDNAIVEYVREPANGKLGLASENFKISNDYYSLTRYPLKARPKAKNPKNKDKKAYKEILEDKKRLINEEKFFPTPKLLLDRSVYEAYIKKYQNYAIEEFDINNSSVFVKLKKDLLASKLVYKDMSIIVDELETLTVIDINSGSRKSKLKKDDFFLRVNLDLIDFINMTLKLRNIGGMVVIDFLRSSQREKIEEAFKKSAKKIGLEAKVYGFSKMGLFEISIKRRGDSLKDALAKRGLLS